MTQSPAHSSSKAGDWLGLTDRVCVVTGGGSGIGRAVAVGLAEAGARVAVLDLNAASAEAVAGEIKAAGACNTSDQTAVVTTAANVAKDIGPCDVLVNNAGILRPGPLESLSLELWNQIIAVNLTGYFLCAQAFGKQMLARKSGVMVHIASIAGKMPQTHSGAYSVTKAGVIMLSRQIATEWGPLGIRSNAVCPGTIRTPLSEEFYKDPNVQASRERVIPVGRIGYPKDIADSVVFLASDRSAFVSGEDILVDGGLEKAIMGLIPRPGHEPVKKG
jgi:glucose 1-dehydrogenase